MQYRINYSDSLEHHGITGMKWGQRNGPPYPLHPFQKRVGDAVAKGRAVLGRAISEAGQKAKAKAEAEVAKRKANAEDLAKRKDEAAKRKKLIEMAKKHPELLSDYEIQQLNNRAQLEKNFKSNYEIKKKGQNAVKEAKDSLFKEVATPALIAVGKAAVITTFSHGDFKTAALHQLNQAWDKQQNQNNSAKEKAKNAGKGKEPKHSIFKPISGRKGKKNSK